MNSRATVWTAGVIVVSLLFIAASHWGALDPVENAVFTIVSLAGVALRSVPLAVGLGIAVAPLSSRIRSRAT